MNLRYSSLRPVALALVITLAGVDTALASSSQTQQTAPRRKSRVEASGGRCCRLKTETDTLICN